MVRQHLTARELRRRGFHTIGTDVRVSRHVQCHILSGSIGDGCRIDDYCILTGNVVLGPQTHISPFVFLSGAGGSLELGTRVGIGSHSAVFTKSEAYDSRRDRQSDFRLMGDVKIGEFSILGKGVTVLPGSLIGRGCVIGVGCVIASSVPAGAYLISPAARTVQKSL